VPVDAIAELVRIVNAYDASATRRGLRDDSKGSRAPTLLKPDRGRDRRLRKDW
jgi:hypothetical protein